MTRLTLVLALLVAVPGAVAGVQQPALEPNTANTLKAPPAFSSPPATLQDMAWFIGQWSGTGLGGTTDEIWSAPAGGAMMGMFRLVRDGTIVFYEFLTLIEQEGSLVLKLKHFNPDLTGWEEKANYVTFRLLKVSPDAAHFSGLTFKRTGPDAMEIFLALRDTKTGTLREERFAMTRRR